MANSGVASVPRRLLPILEWIQGYRREWLLPDVLAGIALWAVMVPEGMAYAGIVGVPPIMGLYTATGLLSALTIGAVAAHGTAEFNSLTSTLAVLIGFLFLFFGRARMGWVASFVPTPVTRGCSFFRSQDRSQS